MPLFLLLWNLAALWFERGPDRDFHNLLPQAIIKRLIDSVYERSKKRLSKAEKRALLALAGLVDLLAPKEKETLRSALRGRVIGLRWLHEEALGETFVPAFFTLRGMSLLRKTSINFSLPVCRRLLEMATDYEDVGPAIERLCEEIRGFEA